MERKKWHVFELSLTLMVKAAYSISLQFNRQTALYLRVKECMYTVAAMCCCVV